MVQNSVNNNPLLFSQDTDLRKTSWQDFALTLASAIGTIFTVWLARKYIDKKTLSSLGLNKIVSKDILYGLLMGLSIISIAFSVLLLFDQIQYLGMQFVFS